MTFLGSIDSAELAPGIDAIRHTTADGRVLVVSFRASGVQLADESPNSCRLLIVPQSTNVAYVTSERVHGPGSRKM